MNHLDDVLDRISRDLARLETKSDGDEWRSGRRYVGPNADRSFVEHVAAGGALGRSAKTYRPPGNTGGLAFGMKALAEGTAISGGYLVEPEFAYEIAQLVRARSAVMAMGVTTIPVRKEFALTSLSTGATAAYVGENARIPTSEETFAQSSILRPRNLAALVPVSNRLLRDADENPSVELVVRRDLAEVLALRQDLAFLGGTGTGEEPLGLRNIAGTTPAHLGANGGSPTWDTLKATVRTFAPRTRHLRSLAGFSTRGLSRPWRRSKTRRGTTSWIRECSASIQRVRAARCSATRSRRRRKFPST